MRCTAGTKTLAELSERHLNLHYHNERSSCRISVCHRPQEWRLAGPMTSIQYFLINVWTKFNRNSQNGSYDNDNINNNNNNDCNNNNNNNNDDDNDKNNNNNTTTTTNNSNESSSNRGYDILHHPPNQLQ